MSSTSGTSPIFSRYCSFSAVSSHPLAKAGPAGVLLLCRSQERKQSDLGPGDSDDGDGTVMMGMGCDDGDGTVMMGMGTVMMGMGR